MDMPALRRRHDGRAAPRPARWRRAARRCAALAVAILVAIAGAPLARPAGPRAAVPPDQAAREVPAETVAAPVDHVVAPAEVAEPPALAEAGPDDRLAGPPPAEPPPTAGDGCGAFRAEGPLVLTYLYYWYEPADLDDPALALRPPDGAPFDWRDPEWHRQQLADMAAAGVDVALAVYWGDRPEWSTHGLARLVEAREALLAEGRRVPALGLFLDTNLYAELLRDEPDLADLTDAAGLDALARQVAGFFGRVPACHSARVDGRPLVFLWRPDTEDGRRLAFDGGTIDALFDRLAERLGERPYLVLERTWDARAAESGFELRADGVFGWGAALDGPRFEGRTAAVGPGYDDRPLPWRAGYARDRAAGAAYARDLREAVAGGAPWLLLETWNELWEQTAIAETAEHGRAYLELTRRYAELHRALAGVRARDGWFDLGAGEGSFLERLAFAPEERGAPAGAEGREGARPLAEEDGAAYFHFALRPRLGASGPAPLLVEVEYLDEGGGAFWLEYGVDDVEAPDAGALAATPAALLEGTGRWRWQSFSIPERHARGRQYGGYGDFRIRDAPEPGGPPHAFRRVVVRTGAGPRPVPLGPAELATLPRASAAPVELRWRGVEGAAGYLLQFGPPDREGWAWHRQGCADPEGRSGGVPGCGGAAPDDEPSYRLPRADAPGPYRWRVWALDARGELIGEPSDWAVFLIGG